MKKGSRTAPQVKYTCTRCKKDFFRYATMLPGIRCSMACRTYTRIEKFEEIGWTESESGCWIWKGHLTPKGYGNFPAENRVFVASRVALERRMGRPLKEGYCACHHCDNPPCVNPDHLFEGTKSDNTRDMIAKGRKVTASKLTEENVRQIRRENDPSLDVEFAQKFGVTKSAIQFVRYRRSWRHV